MSRRNGSRRHGFARSGRPRSAKRGFTLIELLVVIAIIALLVSILTPSLARAKMLATLAACQLNMRNVCMSLHIYSDDYNNCLPPVACYARTWNGNTNMLVNRASWNDAPELFFGGILGLERYVEDGRLFLCPGSTPTNRTLEQVPISTWTENYLSYNWTWGHYAQRWGGRKDRSYPETRLMLAEAAGCWHPPKMSDLTQHGGRGGVNMTMNIAGSDGSIHTIEDWTNRDRWEWSNTYYYPYVERTGEAQVNRLPGDWPWSSYGWMSDAPWGFWTSFDREIFNGGRFPWSN